MTGGVLISGAAGIVGSRVAKAYLAGTDHRVFVVVRARSPQQAEQRIRDVLGVWDVPPAQIEQRVTVLCGDVERRGFGLSQAQLETVVEHCQLLVHAASTIRLDLSLTDARRNIVGGTEHALALFRLLRRPERFGYVSTLEVGGDYRGVVAEEFLTHYRRGFLNSYEQAKSEAEELLRRAGERDGCPITVFRPGMVVGEADSGRALGFQSFYLMLERLLLRPYAPVVPRGCRPETIPVDVLAEGIAALMAHAPARGQVYHLTQGLADRVSFEQFLDLAQPLLEARIGRRLRRPRFVPPICYRLPLQGLARVPLPPLQRHVRRLLIFISYLDFDWQFDCRRARAALAACGVAWPRFEQYLPRLIDYYLAHRQPSRMPL